MNGGNVFTIPVTKRSCFAVLLLSLILIPTTANVSYALQWSVETVDDFATTPKDPLLGYCQGFSLSLDSLGTPSVVYKTSWISGLAIENRLHYAVKSGNRWQTEDIESPSVGADFLSTAIDASGAPHITYKATVFDINGSSHNEIRYAVRFNGSWKIEIVDQQQSMPSGSSIALDAAGAPHISYTYLLKKSGIAYFQLRYATRSGDAWSIETPDPSSNGGESSIAVDAVGSPHILYGGDLRGQHKYAVKQNGSWRIESLKKILGLEAPLVLDASGNPHIVSLDPGSHILWYGNKSNGIWSFEAVDRDAGTLDFGYSLALDSNNNPHILYHKATNIPHQEVKYYGLKHAMKVKGSWVVEDAASGKLEWKSSIAIYPSDKPQIVYCEEKPSQGLKYAVGYAGQPPTQSNITTTTRTISTLTVRNATTTSITTISSTSTTISTTPTDTTTATSTNKLAEPVIYIWVVGAATIVATVFAIVLLRKRSKYS